MTLTPESSPKGEARAPGTAPSGISYRALVQSGVQYVKHQTRYLVASAILPLFALVVQIVNFLLMARAFPLPSGAPPPPGHPHLVDQLTPAILVAAIATLALFKFLALLQWRHHLGDLARLRRARDSDFPAPPIEGNSHALESNSHAPESDSDPRPAPSLTNLFYRVVAVMGRARVLFLVLNALFVVYLQWFVRFFLVELGILASPGLVPPHDAWFWFNVTAQLGLVAYVVLGWRHYLRWGKKLKRLRQFERQVYRDLQ